MIFSGLLIVSLVIHLPNDTPHVVVNVNTRTTVTGTTAAVMVRRVRLVVLGVIVELLV